MELVFQWLLFLGYVVIVAAGIVAILFFVSLTIGRFKSHESRGIELQFLNQKQRMAQLQLRIALADAKEAKRLWKALKKEPKPDPTRPKVFVLDYSGDLAASATAELRETLNALLPECGPEDEILVRLESMGGKAHAYGFAASQLKRIRDRGIPLTVCIDKVAASGGYMMACVANQIIASPFALVGSIGVIAMLPNVHKLLKKLNIDYDELTAGEYKRTVSNFAENTPEGKAKFMEELDTFHTVFKDFVKTHRPQVSIDQVGTGESFYGQQALDLKLVDQLMVSDDWMMGLFDTKNVYQVSLHLKTDLRTRISDWLSSMR
ncbi:MAG: protease SohB [Acidobacteria bacterium]|nr:protease SohB [Acidobacteriota bacterium]